MKALKQFKSITTNDMQSIKGGEPNLPEGIYPCDLTGECTAGCGICKQTASDIELTKKI